MSINQQKAAEGSVSHTEAAAARIEEIRAMQKLIPDLEVPIPEPTTGMAGGLSGAGAVSPEFVELTSIARTNRPELAHGAAIAPEKLRDLLAFASAYEPFLYELEGLTRFVRQRIWQAKNVAGTEALQTYNLANRLAKRPGMGHLKNEVVGMRRALGNRFAGKAKAKPQPPQPVPPPVTTTTEK